MVLQKANRQDHSLLHSDHRRRMRGQYEVREELKKAVPHGATCESRVEFSRGQES